LQAELAIGAVFGSEPPLILRNDEIIRELDLSEADVQAEATRQLALIDERRSTYRQHRPAADIEGKTAIVVDDGAATGATLRVALLGVRGKRPSRLIAAVPVASRSAVARLKEAADEVVCLSAPRNLGAVGYYYADFSEVSDTDVIDLLASRARSKS
jgi:predicted phosphoribosyltransferase